MKSLTKIALGAAVLLAAVAFLQPAHAACGNAYLLNGGGIGIAGTSAYGGLNVPVPNHTANLKGDFWAEGNGVPNVGGIDSGGVDIISVPFNPAYDYGDGTWYNYGDAYLATGASSLSWASDAGIEGCIDSLGIPLVACTCVLLTDEAEGIGYYALLSSQPDGGANFQYGNNIRLQPIPSPTIVNSVRNPSGRDVDLTLNVPALGGVVEDGGCDCGAAKYVVRAQEVPTNAAAPEGRDVGAWVTTLTDAQPVGGTDVGSQIVLNAPCDNDTDLYLTTELIFDSGFSTSVVSGNSTRVACDPNIANPKPLERRRIDNRPASPRKGGARGR